MEIVCANIYNSIQVNIPQRKSGNSFITKMKCQVTSSTTHDVLISKEISYNSYKEICSGEKTKVNLGYNNDYNMLKVENNVLMPNIPEQTFIFESGQDSKMSEDWEVLSSFISLHNILEPNWLDCDCETV